MPLYMKPIPIVILVIMVFSAASGYLFFQELTFPEPSLASEQFSQNGIAAGKCGDGICGPIEKETGFCPQDCPQSQTLMPAPIPRAAKTGFLMGFMLVELNEINYAVDLGARGTGCGFWFLDNKFKDIEGVAIQSLVDKGFEVIAHVTVMPPFVILTDYTDFKNKLRDLVRKKKEISKYWQIGNEPDLIHQNINPSYSAENYIELFLAGSEVIREECPSCKVILAGISNQYDSSRSNYQFYKDILTGIKKKSKFQKPFDVFDVHLYTTDNSKENYTKAERAVSDYKKLLKETGYDYEIEFISTEFGTYSARPKFFKPIPFQAENFQAEALIKLYTAFFNAGVTKAFWVDIINNYKFGFQGEPDGLFDLTGLIYNGKGSYDLANGIKGGIKKESYYAYKTFAAKIQGKNTVEKIGENVYKFSGGGNIVYIAWSGGAKINLPSSIKGTIKVTDYLGNETVEDASEVVIDKSPVFIELMYSSASF